MDISQLEGNEFTELEGSNKTKVLYADKDYLKYDLDAWERFIGELDNFEGNKSNAAELLYYFAEGARDTYKTSPEIVPKALGIVSSDSEFPPFLSSEEYGLIIDKEKLERYSLKDPADSFAIYSGDSLIFKGKYANFYRLGGVEEARHHVYRFNKGIKGDIPAKHVREIGVEAYDATDIELDGLKHQIKYAIIKKMEDDTVKVLQTRHYNAINFREKADDDPTS